MSENQADMPIDKMEVVFDEVLWLLLDSSHDNGLTVEQVQTIWKAVKGFVHHENFDRFYEEKMNTDQEKFKTIYARAFNVQRYLIEADQEQDGSNRLKEINMSNVYGAVDGRGNVLIEGSGDWTSKRVEAGVYEVTFSTAFASQPVVVASGYIPREQGGAASDNTFCVGPITADSVLVRTFDVESKDVDNAGEAQDSEFTFIAIGAR